MIVMDILYLAPFYKPHEIGGAEISSRRYAERLVEHGENVYVATPHFSSVTFAKEEIDGVTVIRFPFPPPLKDGVFGVFNNLVFTVYAAAIFVFIALWHRIEILHVQSSAFLPAAGMTSRITGIPTVSTIRDFGFYLNFNIPEEDQTGRSTGWTEKQYMRWLYKKLPAALRAFFPFIYLDMRMNMFLRRWSLARIDRVIAVSHQMKAFVLRYTECIDSNITVLYNLAPEDFDAPPVDVEEGTLLFLGRLTKLKGVDLLLQAVKHLSVETHLHLVGNTAVEKYREKASEFGVSDQVTFHGQRPHSEIPEFLASYDVVVLPSLREEPLSRVLIESVMLGKPVVATDTGGTAEVIEDKRTGVLVDTTPESLAQGITEMLTNTTEKNRMAEALQKKATLFDPEANTQKLREIYEDTR